MAKPPSSNRSIRLADELWARLNAEAERREVTVNALVGKLLNAALFLTKPNADMKPVSAATFAEIKRTTNATPTWPSGALIEPHHTEDPVPKLTLGSNVMFGHVRPKFGERAKKPKGT